MMKSNQGIFIIVSGPSGAGKGAILKYIRKNNPEFFFPVSCTTRKKRPGERDGEMYYFVSNKKFQKMADEKLFFGRATVHGKHYGVLKEPVLSALKDGKVVIREFDVAGAQKISRLMKRRGIPVLRIFIAVPNWDELLRRIQKRAPISKVELQKRHQTFLHEMRFLRQNWYDVVIENRRGKLSSAVQKTEQAIRDFCVLTRKTK